MYALLLSMRPRQWTKNLLVLAGIIFAGKVNDAGMRLTSLAAFGLFCLAAGAVYIINDLTDRSFDREHPEKENRPIAAGRLTTGTALIFAVLTMTMAAGAGWMLEPRFGMVIAIYFGLQVLYSLVLKNIPLLDVLIVVSGILLRVIGGAVVINVAISPWLLICTGLLAALLILCKRRNSALFIRENGIVGRSVFRFYRPEPLTRAIIAVAGLTLIAYTLYTVSARTVERLGTPAMILTVPFVVVGISRYLYLVFHEGRGQNPEKVLLGDPFIPATVVLWLACAGWILYCW